MAAENTSDLSFAVKEYANGDYEDLLDMYDRFSPKGKFQGMPPCAPESRRQWIRHLSENGKNFLAWKEGRVVGHGVLLPDFNKFDAEYLINWTGGKAWGAPGHAKLSTGQSFKGYGSCGSPWTRTISGPYTFTKNSALPSRNPSITGRND